MPETRVCSGTPAGANDQSSRPASASYRQTCRHEAEVHTRSLTFFSQIAPHYFFESVECNVVFRCSCYVRANVKAMTTMRRAFLQLNARNSFFRLPRNQRSRNGQRNASSGSGPPKTSGGAQRSSQTASNGAVKTIDEPIDIPTSLWYQRLGPVTDFFSWFHQTQQKRPLMVQVCTSLIVYLCGDLLAQEIGGEKYDGTRTLRMLTIGAVVSIPGYKWYA